MLTEEQLSILRLQQPNLYSFLTSVKNFYENINEIDQNLFRKDYKSRKIFSNVIEQLIELFYKNDIKVKTSSTYQRLYVQF